MWLLYIKLTQGFSFGDGLSKKKKKKKKFLTWCVPISACGLQLRSTAHVKIIQLILEEQKEEKKAYRLRLQATIPLTGTRLWSGITLSMRIWNHGFERPTVIHCWQTLSSDRDMENGNYLVPLTSACIRVAEKVLFASRSLQKERERKRERKSTKNETNQIA